ncbi:GtrA family protein [Actinosynnema sp. NPDC050801]|uniref:GtrA family protein n=1 Tax=unclassified Actinosynnema TaxID=2637065 RepID=UPI0034011F98
MTGRLRRLVRFGLVGVLNTAVYYALYLSLRTLTPYLAAHLVAFGLAMVGSYFLNCRFTFRTRPALRTFLLFPLSNATNLAVSTGGLYLLVSGLDVDQRIAPLLASAAAIPCTFLVAQLVLIGRPAPASPPVRH